MISLLERKSESLPFMSGLQSNVPSQSSGLKYAEMSPEVTLVEFISTSAAFHGVKRQSIKDLEWDILKVFPNNIMPANAAAWYMAKRRFYVGNGSQNQLLPFLLKNYPRKFLVRGTDVEFLEVYNKDTAKRKMNQMIRQGLVAYFAHKVEEYGVYFFDPYYYETVEPFHENLRAVMSHSGNIPRSNLLPRFFSTMKDKFVYQAHDENLVTISKEPVEVKINTIGIIVSMIDNQFGIIQFPNGSGTEKAYFSAKALFRDGILFRGDPMKLPPMEFDGYRVPMLSGKFKDGASLSFTWHAVLVWCGRKPNPKFCSTKEDLIKSPYFQGQVTPGMTAPNGCVSYDELMIKSPKSQVFGPGKGACMQVGEVLKIKRNGAVVSLGKDSTEEAFIPGWSHKNLKIPGFFLTTTQGVELAEKDVITFCLDQSSEEGNNKNVGCNVTVLKHGTEKKTVIPAFEPGSLGFGVVAPDGNAQSGDLAKKKKKRNRKKTVSTSDKETITENQKGTKKSQRKKTPSESQPKKSPKPQFNYFTFLLTDEIDTEDIYDSDEDPSFIAPASHDPDLDYDEYSDGEVPEDEMLMLVKESSEKLEIEELRKKLDMIVEEEESVDNDAKEEVAKEDKKEVDEDKKDKILEGVDESKVDPKPVTNEAVEKKEETLDVASK